MPVTRRQFLAASAVAVSAPLAAADKVVPLVLVVTDPLAKDNSCPCVAGYGQRDYRELGKHLTAKLGRPVVVEFGESLAVALKKTADVADIVIGKDSMLLAHAKERKLNLVRLAALTGKDGLTTQEGWLVVPATDPVLTADGLNGYRILFGPAAAEEKNNAPKSLLKDLGVSYTGDDKDIAATCSVCATKLLELSKAGETKVAGVVSSYAVPLLEGCGTIKKGDLKVVGKSDPVPFISAFAADSVPAELRAKITAALLEVKSDPALCTALETKDGFVEPAKKK